MPVVEQLVKAGIDYMNSDSVEQGASAPSAESAVDSGHVVLLTLRGDADNLRDKIIAAVNTVEGIEVSALDITKRNKEINDV